MAKMIEILCKCGCGRTKMVRQSDVNRGWGLYYDKSCKARDQEKRTGQHRAYLRGEGVSHAAKLKGEDPAQAVLAHVVNSGGTINGYDDDDFYDPSWDAHKLY